MPRPPAPETLAPIDRVLRALADPSRRRIVERLGQGPASVSSLAELLGVSLTAVSQHLQILAEAGLAATEKTGRVRTARRDPAGFALLEQWLGDSRTIWERRLDALGELMKD
ncbi:metalloregulator ArsR/SmtB family transcription factor [Sphingomonas sp.]|uniref:ArsR/SmtB family transcription factor n=1 Tax=Sphingomonas sp. TaxID=28214 RepID=UPI001B2B0CAF|nr:metalloregulator ArsR/SmtB family transcription factor [Sphingomonas sp.]MBO9712883.1 winged helix-turn-helix transcriptional regulator [Sphingomonas sp.]